MGYWGEDGQTRVTDTMTQLREERELLETTPWVVNYYPDSGNPGLVEFLLDPPEELSGETDAAFGEDGETPPAGDGELAPEGGEAPAEDEQPEKAPEEPAQDPSGEPEETPEGKTEKGG